MTASLVLLFAVAWVSPGNVEEVPIPMDSNALYAALNTIAQCAAALAALIGFFVMWRLDRLRDEVLQSVQTLLEWIHRMSPGGVREGLPRKTIMRAAKDKVRNWEELPRQRKDLLQEQLGMGSLIQGLQEELERKKHLQEEQQRLMRILGIFLVVTLEFILVPAIVGIVHVDWLKKQVWTPWPLYGASAWLAGASAYVVWQVARSSRTLAILTLLAWASPALAAGPVRRQTHYEPTLHRWQTLCDNGTRGTSTWSPTMQRWQTTVTSPPGKACTGQMHARTRQGQPCQSYVGKTHTPAEWVRRRGERCYAHQDRDTAGSRP